MNTDEAFPKRKPTRLKNFDYSTAGAYFITVCTRDRMQILSDVVRVDEGLPPTAPNDGTMPVGEGLSTTAPNDGTMPVGEGLAPPEIKFITKLKPCGEIAKRNLQSINNRFPSVTVEAFIIMPDHIHMILLLHRNTGGASPSPTIDDVICAFKSLTSRHCKEHLGVEKIFQRSSAEHIIRDWDDYETRRKYIYENPIRWYYKHLKQ